MTGMPSPSKGHTMLDRRAMLKRGTGALAMSAVPWLRAQQPSTSLQITVSDSVLTRVPTDFNGLSYESPQLANPAFFNASNKGLVKLFRELSPAGVLRLGGNLSAFTGWRDDPSVPVTDAERAVMQRGKKYWEWDLTDPTIKDGTREAVFNPECIRALTTFLQATGWKLIYGLNFATGTPQQAAAEAACVQKTVGSNLLAFQLGNEDDFWRGGFRPRDWEFAPYLAQWQEWTEVIRAAVPAAHFAGPDVAVRLDWAEKMAAAPPPGLVLLSGHHYAMGPAGDPRMTGEHLLGPDPEVTREIETARRIQAASGLGFRNTECNSCFHGGQKGVSDSYASALWCADYMLTLAQAGDAGVNLHGGGDGIYSPIVGDASRGFTARPLYFGMQFAQAFCGAEMLRIGPSETGPVNVFAGRKGGELSVALINKGAAPASVTLDVTKSKTKARVEAWKLSGPSLDSRTGVTFARTTLSPSPAGTWLVPAYSALLLKHL